MSLKSPRRLTIEIPPPTTAFVSSSLETKDEARSSSVRSLILGSSGPRAPDSPSSSSKFHGSSVPRAPDSPSSSSKRRVRFAEEEGSTSSTTPPSDTGVDLSSSPPVIYVLGKVEISRDSSPDESPALTPKSLLKVRESMDYEKFQSWQSTQKKLLSRLHAGDLLLKYADNMKACPRLFSVSEDGTELLWRKVSLSARILAMKLPPSSLLLATVNRVVIGPRTGRFLQYDWTSSSPKSKPQNMFSIVTEDRSVDIEVSDCQQMSTWILGLESVAPLCKTKHTRARIHWERLGVRLAHIGAICDVGLPFMWVEVLRWIKKSKYPLVEYLASKEQDAGTKKKIHELFEGTKSADEE